MSITFYGTNGSCRQKSRAATFRHFYNVYRLSIETWMKNSNIKYTESFSHCAKLFSAIAKYSYCYKFFSADDISASVENLSMILLMMMMINSKLVPKYQGQENIDGWKYIIVKHIDPLSFLPLRIFSDSAPTQTIIFTFVWSALHLR